MIEIEVVSNVWPDQIFYYAMYSPEGFIIVEGDVGVLDIDEIIQNYPYHIIVYRIRKIREEKLLKMSLNAISKEILGRNINNIQNVGTATNDIISKWRNLRK